MLLFIVFMPEESPFFARTYQDSYSIDIKANSFEWRFISGDKNMKRKILLLNMGLIGLSAVAVTGVVLGNGGIVSGQIAGDGSVWNHYLGVDNTVSTKGIKEYWVNCSTHETVFEAPMGTIEEKGTPSREFIEALESTDERLIQAGGYRVSFESSSDANYIIPGNRSCIGSKTVEASSSSFRTTHQNGYLKIQTTASTTFSCTFLGTYLTGVFSDPDVVALNFDMKCSVGGVTKLSYGNAVNKTYEYDCTKNDQPNYGLQNTWKTFSLTRAMYQENLQSNGNLICTVGGQVPVGSYIYFDNLRPVTESLSCYSFDSGRNVPADSDPTQWYGYVGSYRNNSNEEIVTVSTTQGTALNFEMDDSTASDGVRSAKFHRTGNQNLWIRMLKLNLAETSAVSIDIYSSATLNVNDSVHSIGTGKGHGLIKGSTGQLRANTWTTFTIPASEIDGNCIITMNGSPDFYVNIDNIKIIPAIPA